MDCRGTERPPFSLWLDSQAEHSKPTACRRLFLKAKRRGKWVQPAEFVLSQPQEKNPAYPEIAVTAIPAILSKSLPVCYQNVVMSSVKNSRQTTRGMPDVPSPGEMRVRSELSSRGKVQRAGEAAAAVGVFVAAGGQPAGSCFKARSEPEVRINNYQ